MTNWTNAQIKRCNKMRKAAKGKTAAPYNYLKRKGKSYYRCSNCNHNVITAYTHCRYCEIKLDWKYIFREV